MLLSVIFVSLAVISFIGSLIISLKAYSNLEDAEVAKCDSVFDVNDALEKIINSDEKYDKIYTVLNVMTVIFLGLAILVIS